MTLNFHEAAVAYVMIGMSAARFLCLHHFWPMKILINACAMFGVVIRHSYYHALSAEPQTLKLGSHRSVTDWLAYMDARRC